MVHSALNINNNIKTNSQEVPTEDISKSIISNGMSNKLDLTASTIDQNNMNNSNSVGIIQSNKKGMFYALNQETQNTKEGNIDNKGNNKSVVNLSPSKLNVHTVYGNIKSPYKIGDVYCFCYYNGCALITISTHFIFPLTLLIFMNFINVGSIIFLSKYIHIFFLVLSILIFGIQTLFHWVMLVRNPGVPNRKWYLSQEIIQKLSDENVFKQHFNVARYQICQKCLLLIDKELSIIHCEYCNVCCEEYDHHCPWVGKCIGKYNGVIFKWFIYSTIAYLLYSIALFVCVLLSK